METKIQKIVAIHFEETEAALHKLAIISKRHNEIWDHTNMIMIEKDVTE